MKFCKKAIIFVIFAMILPLALAGCFGGDKDSDEESFETKEYTAVIFDANGISIELTLYYDSETGVPAYFSGYTFDGYFTEANGGGMRVTDNNGFVTSEFNSYLSENKPKTVNMYPKLEEISYTLTFVSNCDTQVAPQTHKYLDTVTLPALEKEGCEFAGWSRNRDDWSGVKEIYAGYISEENVTMYGIFRAKDYRLLCFYSDSGQYVSNTVYYGEDYTVEVKEKDGYNFRGYYSEENGGGTKFTDKEGKSLAAWTITSVERSVNAYAYYTEADLYTLTYPNNGLISLATVTFVNAGGMNSNSTYDIKEYLSNNEPLAYRTPTYSKEGYYFDGWYTDSGFRRYYDFSGSITEDMKLYPKFTPINNGEYTANRTYTSINNNQYGGSIGLSYRLLRIGYYIFDVGSADEENEMELTISYSMDDADGARFEVRNESRGRVLYDEEVYDTSTRSFTIAAKYGDIIAIGAERTHNGSGGTVSFTFKNKPTVTSTAKCVLPSEFTKEVTLGNNYTLPVYKIAGKTFLGYYTSSSDGTKLTDENGKSLAPWSYESDKTIYARYTST